MDLDTQFQERLQQEFGDRIRIRWSQKQQSWLVEQKVARGQMYWDRYVPEHDDELIAVRDGYLFLMHITPGDRMRCPGNCGSTLKSPIRQTELVVCPVCKIRGYSHKHILGFFPLNDSFITYLKSIDPLRRDAKKDINKVDDYNERIVRGAQRRMSNEAEAYGKDEFARLTGIPTVGLSGSVKMWINAPESKPSWNTNG